MVLYKAVLKNWFKGTGGGSGDRALFEGWDDARLSRYNIDMDTYDHTDVSSRPAILIDSYSKQKYPFLTIIHLWDKDADYLLSSKHDPLKIGRGEPGMTPVDDQLSLLTQDSTKSASTSPRMNSLKRKAGASAKNVENMMQSIISMCRDNDSQYNPEAPKKKENDSVENLPIDQITNLIEQHQKHLKCLQDNKMCTDEKKNKIFAETDRLFSIISNRTSYSADVSK